MPTDLFAERFKLKGELGRGGKAVVYRAHDTTLNRDVAVKVLGDPALGTEGRANLLREAQSAAGLNHPNIVTVHDAGQAPSINDPKGLSPYIVMELVEGQTLHQSRPTSIEAIIEVAIRICTGLEHAHSHGIIHRDLKPENVLIASNGIAKLVDFGLARSMASRVTSEGAISGTVFYMAPEQALGQDLDDRVDLYALGVMLYELTAGQLPFTADDPLAVISQHIHAPPVPPSTYNAEIPRALETLILSLLSKKPKERPDSALDVKDLLERIAKGDVSADILEDLTSLDRIVRGRMIGREQELEEAVESWQRAASGKPHVLLVSGDPGIGKTRLLRELTAHVEVTGGMVLIGESYEDGGAPYAPIGQMIHQAIDRASTDALDLPEILLADLITLAPILRARYPDLPPNPPLEVEAEQQRLFESVVEFCRLLSEQSPVLLALEDAHWADDGTLSLIHHLARRSRSLGTSMRLLIVLTYREVELDLTLALNNILHDLNRERLTHRIKLLRFDREQTGEMLAVLLQEEITPDFLDGIYRETEGNPFFIEEVCKSLIEAGQLYREGGRWRRPDMAEMGIPQSVRVAIQSRVEKLPKQAQKTLEQAAIFGRNFDFDTMVEISDLDEDTLIEALEYAEQAQLIEEGSRTITGLVATKPCFTFAHALIPGTLLEGLSGLRRARMHHHAGLALERLNPNRLDELAPKLGRHFAEAGEGEKAVDYLLQAGDRARELYANKEAARNYEGALDFLRDQGAHERAARTLMKLGLVFHTTLDFERSRQAYQEGFALWQRADVSELTEPSSPAPHPFRVPWGNPPTLDPTMAADNTSIEVITHLFSGLVELTPELEIIPDMARSWEMTESGRQYIFHLRDDVRWSDGAPVTAGDFEFAWKRVLDPTNKSSFSTLFDDIKGASAYHTGKDPNLDHVEVRAIDDHTLSVELERPAGFFLHVLTLAPPVPRHIVELHGPAWAEPENIVTNGPFRLDYWKQDDRLILTRSPDYHGKFTGNLQKVEFFLMQDWSESLGLYESDEVDVAGSNKPEEMDRAIQRHGSEYFSGPSAGTEYVGFNLHKSPFNDPRVRRAFAHALDRNRLADVVRHGYVAPATGGFVPPGIPGHASDIGLKFDPDLARRLLAEAGYPNGEDFPVDQLAYPLEASQDPGVKEVLSQWKTNLGLTIKERPVRWDDYIGELAGGHPSLHRIGWSADYPDPDSFLRLCLSQFRYRGWSEAYDDLIDRARSMKDQAERMSIYQEADRMLVNEAALIPLTYGRANILLKPWVRRFRPSPIRNLYLKEVILEDH